MRVFESRIDPRSAEFETNRAAYAELVRVLRERQQVVLDGGAGRERAIERHLARGKIMVRDRIDCVIDAGTPFLELSTLSGWGQYDDGAPGAGIVTGIGRVLGISRDRVRNLERDGLAGLCRLSQNVQAYVAV